VGYPGDGRYLEFHKRHGRDGLRYWRVTSSSAGLQDKEPYQPDAAKQAIQAHAEHFCGTVAEALERHRETTGRNGVVFAPFDAELFGHWWYEGPAFLREMTRKLQAHGITPTTASRVVAERPADKAVSVGPGTWGAGGDTRVWCNEDRQNSWLLLYRAEERMHDLLGRSPWRTDEAARELLTEAGRQLLLLGASDWPFVITTEGAVDYGVRRLSEHAANIEDLANGVEDRCAGIADRDPVVEDALRRCRLRDPVFQDLDLAWWVR
jgi:1,4-alpha-glucan branching enzyme